MPFTSLSGAGGARRAMLDRELDIFRAASTFSERAIQAFTKIDFAAYALQSIAEIFQLECAAFLAYDETSNKMEVLASSGIEGIEDDYPLENQWIIGLGLLKGTSGAFIETPDPKAEPWGKLGLYQIISSPFYDNHGDLKGLIIAGITQKNRSLYEKIRDEVIPSFMVFNQQVSTLFHDLEVHANLQKMIQEREKAQNALKESEEEYRRLYEESKKAEELYRSLLHSSADAIIIYDLEGNAKYVSPAFTEIFGWTLEELMGKPIPFVPESEMESSSNKIAKIAESGKPIQGFETRRLTKDRSILEVSLSGSRYDDHEGNPAGMLVILNDISERKQLEKRLQQVQKMEAIGTLAGGIAHNFNNLLMGIQGYASLMLLETDSDHPHHQFLQNIEKQVLSGSQLTKQLLGYATEVEYELKPIDLNQLVEQMVETFGVTKREVRIHTELSDDLSGIVGDRAQIEQVLMNLFLNAADAMSDGGDLFLETRGISRKEMVGKPYKPRSEHYVLLKVMDTGVGMDEKTIERIFEPFFTTKGLVNGTGLGLATAYGIIKAHGGYIDVYSSPGQGTAFEVYLPVAEPHPSKLEDPIIPLIEGNGTVLLVDDEETVIDVSEMMLDKLGYFVISAMGGKEAVELYRMKEKMIDFVILDLVMQDMSGEEIYEKLKEINPHVKVLLSSGHKLDNESLRILELPSVHSIQKPFTMDQLSKKLGEVVGKQTIPSSFSPGISIHSSH